LRQMMYEFNGAAVERLEERGNGFGAHNVLVGLPDQLCDSCQAAIGRENIRYTGSIEPACRGAIAYGQIDYVHPILQLGAAHDTPFYELIGLPKAPPCRPNQREIAEDRRRFYCLSICDNLA
jgi:hypothetical protein